MFEVAEVSCGAWSAGGGLVPLLLDGSWQLLDLEGEMSVTPLEFAEEPDSLAIVAVADDVAVAADAADGTLVGFSGGTAACWVRIGWRSPHTRSCPVRTSHSSCTRFRARI